MPDSMLQTLQRASKAGRPKTEFKVGGRLHDSALGAIYYAKTSRGPLILKTMNLKNQNMWCVSIKNKRTTLRGLHDSNVLYISESKRDAREWLETWCKLPGRESALLAKIAWLETLVDAKDGVGPGLGQTSQTSHTSPSSAKIGKRRLNEYLNEGLVGLILSRDLKLPHVVKTREIWIDDAEGFILQEYGGHSMQKNMVNLSLKEFKSIVVQVLVTLAVAQQQLEFKHHDVHLDNVFLSDLKDVSHLGQKLDSQHTWQYDLVSKGLPFVISVEHCNKLAKLGDFGLSSVTDRQSGIRYERVDYANLDGAEIEWGEWSSIDRGLYDAVVFLSKFFLCDEMELCPSANIAWAQKIYTAIKAEWPEVECSNIGRPFRGHEGRAQIVDLLRLPIFAEFQQHKEASIKMMPMAMD